MKLSPATRATLKRLTTRTRTHKTPRVRDVVARWWVIYTKAADEAARGK